MILSGDQILKYLPHRDPFLFIDEVISLEEGNNIHAVMYVKDENVFLEGHFPGNPIVPVSYTHLRAHCAWSNSNRSYGSSIRNSWL